VSLDLRTIYIDPSYRVFNSDRLFDIENPILNRDGQLLPFYRLRETLRGKGVTVCTADFLLQGAPCQSAQADYYSLGLIDDFQRVRAERRARLAAFVIMEPPIVASNL
jgi:hypothetical protein